jgi:hypothetical protein
MHTIASIQRSLKKFDEFARKHTNDEQAYKRKWKTLFNMNMSDLSAKSFAQYYKEMRSKTRRMNGGSAPLQYQMGPGLHVQNYGNFPVEAATDPASIRNLDVFFQDSLVKGCGTENSSLSVPVDMGSNKVGGKRSRSRSHSLSHSRARARAHSHKRGQRAVKNQRKTYRKHRASRRQRGGDMWDSLVSRAPLLYNATPFPNAMQSVANIWNGGTEPVPVSSSPAVHTWQPMSSGIAGTINPGIITRLPDDLNKLASPAPWQSK